MEDKELVEQLYARREEALGQLQSKFKSYLMKTAGRILTGPEDAEECVNDAILAAWNSIPPQRPEHLSTYLGKLTRRIALDRLKEQGAQKRGGRDLTLALEELEEILPAEGDPTEAVELEELGKRISRFLREEEKLNRQLFLGRYYFYRSVKELAKDSGLGESNVKMRLKRTRDRLAEVLTKEGYV